ncbi:ATP-dependent RNA helicase [Skeletonema marinoi]|uniref:ATP-dependent RNA helicase n=1 Tax=Skeletonema marinoi TaxID=267567 RepID=A0AAD8XT84_9STRA|nr:ATP-dependent RNA helicase [Skeletonema marinoi]
MDDLFNMLSSSARIDKSKRKKQSTTMAAMQKAKSASHVMKQIKRAGQQHNAAAPDSDEDSDGNSHDGSDDDEQPTTNKKKRPKKQHSAEKLAQIHQEEINAFRRRMGIRLSSDNKHEIELIPDPISSFREWKCPQWWSSSLNKTNNNNNSLFDQLHQTILNNIEQGRWMEPTPIQMQGIPSLMDRRDVMGCAPTGSGKSGAFVLPALMISKCPEEVYYGHQSQESEDDKQSNGKQKGKNKQQQKKKNNQKKNAENQQGHVRTILLAPSRELSSQLHREVQRLSSNMPFKFHAALLSKSNTGLAISNQLGGKSGLDCLVATPLRLVECLERGMKLRGLRLIVLDEADRLLDASDGKVTLKHAKNVSDSDEESESEDEEQPQSGSSQSRTFLQQIDSILSHLPNSATRALFSATLGPSVRHLSESILRSPIDITTGINAGTGGNSAAGGASEHIKQELKFVGREEGKLLAIRQLVAEGITPPVLIFMQSKERAQALFGELLYDGIRVDVIHAGRSPSAREASVAKFRKGDTWVLICTDLVARGVDFKAVNLVINYDLPMDGVSYVHRIGRTGRAGRKGRAITFFTEADFDGLRTIANVMKLSGCVIPEWMLTIKRHSALGGPEGMGRGGGKKRKRKNAIPPRRSDIDTTPSFDKKKQRRKKQFVENGKKKKSKNDQTKN